MLFKENGFTLVEILVLIVIVSIIMMSIVPLISNSIVNVLKIGKRDRAVNIAANFLEYIYQEVINSSNLNEDNWINFATRDIDFNNRVIDIEYKQYSNLEVDSGEMKLLFGKVEINGGYKMKIVFYYNNKNEKIVLESFVRG